MRILEDESDIDIEAANNRDDDDDTNVKVDEESSSTSASTAAGCFWKWQVKNLEFCAQPFYRVDTNYGFIVFFYSFILSVLFFSSY
jgi:hypothetical protein